MRKAIATLMVLVLLASVGIVYAHRTINAEKDQVVLTETTLLGDKSASDGLTIVTNSDYNNNRLVWNTTHITGKTPETSTIFTFSSDPKYPRSAPTYNGIRLESHIETGLETNTPFSNLSPIKQVYRKLYDETEPGHESSTVIRVADYLDYYPILMDIELPKFSLHYYETSLTLASEIEKTIVSHYRDFFRIPVLEDEYLEIHIRKGPSNTIGAGSGSVEYGDRFNLYTYSALTDDAMYFLIDVHTYEEKVADTSLIPGGYGIYCQPYGFDGPNGAESVDPTELSMVFALDPHIRPYAFVYNEVYRQLQLLVKENGQAVLYIIDENTHQQLQRIVIDDLGTDGGIWQYYFEDTYIVLTMSDNRLAVIDADSAGTYTLRFVNAYEPNSLASQLIRTIEDTAWNGTQLAIISHEISPYEYNYYDQYRGFYLGIFDKSGIQYGGKYISSLTSGYDPGYHYYVHPRDYNPFVIEWNQ